MATTTAITTTYSGEWAGQYISAALLSASTLENGGVEIVPNVDFKHIIQHLDTDSIVKNSTCDFDATSTVTLTERILEVEAAQVNLQLCKKSFWETWQVAEMGANNGEIPNSFSDYLIGHISAKVASKIETNLWEGVNANVGEVDGLAVRIAGDAGLLPAQTTAAVAGGVNAGNVIAEMGKIVDTLPPALFGKEDLKLYVSQNVYKSYTRALGGFAAAGLGANGYEGRGTNQVLGALYFDGVEVFLAQGLGANKMILAQKSNLFFGTSLLSAAQDVRLIDMTPIDLSNNFRFGMTFFQGTQIGIIADICLYA
jgi:hypothetical protein|tara:strand:- start:3534 stop:4469 length:936 start_codon:yes stop_codon:yes gene_type:complete